jgi:thioredoxin reductase
MTKRALPKVAVLGAGPIGLETALYALNLGYPTTLYESGQVAEYVNRWGFVKLFTPFGANVTPLGRRTLLRDKPTREFPADSDIITGRDWREAYLVPLSELEPLKSALHLQTAVLTIGRQGWRKTDPHDLKQPLPPFRLLVRSAQNLERFETADIILDCTGTYGRPNWLGDGGIPAAGEIASRPQVMHWLDDVLGAKRQHYANKSIILLGAGYSAATMMCELATLAEHEQATWVIWLTHGPRGAPIARVANDPWKERDRLAVRANSLACRCDGNLEYHATVAIEELISHGPDKGFRVGGRVNNKPQSWEVERVIANVGYRPDPNLVAELRVGETTRGEIMTPEPNYFILGIKSHGRDGNFLLRDGHEQIRRVFALLANEKRLDLYAKAA